VRGERLVAQRFSTSSLDLRGEPFVIAEEVECSSNAHADFSVSDNGVLAYCRSSENLRKLVWVDRAGRELEVVGEPANYSAPRLSPGGERIAVTIWEAPRSSDIWLIDPARGTTSRFTFDPGRDWLPVWSPDGREIVFSSDRDSSSIHLYRKSASGAHDAELLPAPEPYDLPFDWSTDGRFIAVAGWKEEFSQNVLVMPANQDGEPVEFLKSPFYETNARFSPDARYLAYCSEESGSSQVYVQSYPDAQGKWQVSNRGGSEPEWRRDGKELFYLAPDRTLMSVKVTTSPTFTAGVPEPLFSAQVIPSPWEWNRYAVTADGQRFLLLEPVSPETATPISIIVNWTEILPEP
jgi:Tol biopolymer transport system component